jgi:hypothetical protein
VFVRRRPALIVSTTEPAGPLLVMKTDRSAKEDLSGGHADVIASWRCAARVAGRELARRLTSPSIGMRDRRSGPVRSHGNRRRGARRVAVAAVVAVATSRRGRAL